MGRRIGFLALLVLLAAPASAQAQLKAKPSPQVADTLPQGFSRVGEAMAYRPAGAPAVPGLLVLFHGAGGNAARFITLFQDEADRRGLILLSVQSTDMSWDIVRSGEAPSGRAPTVRPGIDAKRTDAALKALFAKVRIDPAKVIAAGFSDGASYALSIGLANDHLFTGIVALAPGFVRKTGNQRRQRIAIAHGKADQVLPYASAREIAALLRGNGYPVNLADFDGGHGVEPGSLAASLDFVLGARP